MCDLGRCVQLLSLEAGEEVESAEVCRHNSATKKNGTTTCDDGWHNVESSGGWSVSCRVGGSCYYTNSHGGTKCLDCLCVSQRSASQSTGVCPVESGSEVYEAFAEAKRELAFDSSNYCHVWNQDSPYADCYTNLDSSLRNRDRFLFSCIVIASDVDDDGVDALGSLLPVWV